MKKNIHQFTNCASLQRLLSY